MYTKLSFTEKYALLCLDNLESQHHSTLKKLSLKAISASAFLEEALAKEDLSSMETSSFHLLLNQLCSTKSLSQKKLDQTEKNLVSILKEKHVIEETPDLLSCDINYYTSGIKLMNYRSDAAIYTRILECLRAEALEEDSLTEESFCLLWLLRENSLLYDFFSSLEQETLEKHLTEFSMKCENYKLLLQTKFRNTGESISNFFLSTKKKATENQFMQGVNLIFPFINRRNSIFIDTVILGTSSSNRRLEIMAFLSEHGHFVEDITLGEEKLLKIDNGYYRLFPTVRVCRFPIQGMALVPIYH